VWQSRAAALESLVHLKGSSNKQSNFKAMALAPDELLIIFP